MNRLPDRLLSAVRFCAALLVLATFASTATANQCIGQQSDGNPYACDSGGNCTWWGWKMARDNWGDPLPMWGDAKLRTSAPEGAHVTLALRDGKHYTAFRANPKGSSTHPLSQQELEQGCVVYLLPAGSRT